MSILIFNVVLIDYILFYFWSSSLVDRARTFKRGEVECLGFEPQTLHINM